MGSQSNPFKGNCHCCDIKDQWKNEFRTTEHFSVFIEIPSK